MIELNYFFSGEDKGLKAPDIEGGNQDSGQGLPHLDPAQFALKQAFQVLAVVLWAACKRLDLLQILE